MRLPPQSPPVRRPELVVVHRCIDVKHGTPEQLVAIRLQITHGANYNDPPFFRHPAAHSFKEG